MVEVIRLRAGDATVELAPAVGGAIAAFTLGGADILRPTPRDARDAADVRRFACYPLVPYSNRIADARLAFGLRQHPLARNFGNAAHSIHGVGWQRAWTIVDATSASAQVALAHEAGDAGGWPWPFRVAQTFALAAQADGALLSVRLAIENAGTEPFPFGLGWHPFFPKDADTTLGFAAAGVWENDTTQLPVARIGVPARWRFDPPRALGALALDHVFESATARATIAWPARRRAADIEADGALDRRVVYVPEGRDFLAFEPVSHMTDAFNRAARGEPRTGTRVLPPGATFSCTMRIVARTTGPGA
jgi:aldose 1-epimerase